jgi:hypothetical protein
VDATQQQICAKAKPGLLDGVKVTATTEAPFHEVKVAMVRGTGRRRRMRLPVTSVTTWW